MAFTPERDRWFAGSPLGKIATPRSDGSFVLSPLAPSARRVTVAEDQQQRVRKTLSAFAR